MGIGTLAALLATLLVEIGLKVQALTLLLLALTIALGPLLKRGC